MFHSFCQHHWSLQTVIVVSSTKEFSWQNSLNLESILIRIPDKLQIKKKAEEKDRIKIDRYIYLLKQQTQNCFLEFVITLNHMGRKTSWDESKQKSTLRIKT